MEALPPQLGVEHGQTRQVNAAVEVERVVQVARVGGVAAEHEVEAGVVPPEHLDDHPFKHVLSNYVGMGARMHVEVHEVELAPGDIVLLCSDGLTGMVPSPVIAAILHGAPNPQDACRDLVVQANDMGGDDNVTAVVARWASLA